MIGTLLGLGAVLLVMLAVSAWCIWTATRLDRLHLKVESANASLRESLQRRAAIGIELASTGLSDPASAVLLMAASADARDNEGDWLAQSSLSQTIDLLSLRDDDALVSQLHSAARQASISRRIHNDLVVRTNDLRGRRRVRWFNLAGRAPAPETVEFDDGSG